MNSSHRSILSRLDDAVRWTGIPARVADALSDDPSVDRKHQPLRWVPLLVIAVSCLQLVVCLIWPLEMDRISPGAAVSIMTGMMVSIMTGVLVVYTSGPLGKPSLEDDEREAALRKDAYLFCFGLLAALNCIGQLMFMGLYLLQGWSSAQVVMMGASAFMLNLTLLGCLPTLYASWKWRGSMDASEG